MHDTMTRRQAIGIGAAGALGAMLTLAGCSAGEGAHQDEGYVDFDFVDDILPLGSVVVLDDGTDPEVARLIIARRPVYLQDDHIYDYAGIVWPIGLMSDVAGAPLENEIHLFDSEAIKGVKFVGYAAPLENTAAAELAAANESDETALEALLPLAMEMGVIESAGVTDGAQ